MDTIKTINRINKVKQIDPLSAINQIQPITTIQPLGNKMKEVTDTVTSSLSDYNNPLEINSVADALFNTDARKLKYGKAKGTAARALIDYINERAITPIKKGDWSTVGLNALTGFSEDMDLFARPFKALTVGGKEAAAQDRARNRSDYSGLIGNVTGATTGAIIGAIVGSLVPGLGTAIGATVGGAIGGATGTLAGTISGEVVDSIFADRESDNSGLVGRVNYDYDTGNFFSDMALEIISDPTGWVDLVTNLTTGGVNIAATATAKTATNTVESMAKTAGKTLTKSTSKVVNKSVKRTLKQTTKEASKQSIKTIGDSLKLIKGTKALKRLQKDPLSEETFKYLSDIALENVISSDTIKAFQRTRTILNSLDTLSNGIELKPFSKINTAPAYIRNFKLKAFGMDTSRDLLRMSTLGNPIATVTYGTATLIKPLLGPTAKSYRINYILQHIDGIDPETGAINVEKYAKLYNSALTADAFARLLDVGSNNANLNALLESMTNASMVQVKSDIVKYANEMNNAKDALEKYYAANQLVNYLDRVFGEQTSECTTEQLLELIVKKFAPGDNLNIINDSLDELTESVQSIKVQLDSFKQAITDLATVRKENKEAVELASKAEQYKTAVQKYRKSSKKASDKLSLYKEVLGENQYVPFHIKGKVNKYDPNGQYFKQDFIKLLTNIRDDTISKIGKGKLTDEAIEYTKQAQERFINAYAKIKSQTVPTIGILSDVLDQYNDIPNARAQLERFINERLDTTVLVSKGNAEDGIPAGLIYGELKARGRLDKIKEKYKDVWISRHPDWTPEDAIETEYALYVRSLFDSQYLLQYKTMQTIKAQLDALAQARGIDDKLLSYFNLDRSDLLQAYHETQTAVSKINKEVLNVDKMYVLIEKSTIPVDSAEYKFYNSLNISNAENDTYFKVAYEDLLIDSKITNDKTYLSYTEDQIESAIDILVRSDNNDYVAYSASTVISDLDLLYKKQPESFKDFLKDKGYKFDTSEFDHYPESISELIEGDIDQFKKNTLLTNDTLRKDYKDTPGLVDYVSYKKAINAAYTKAVNAERAINKDLIHTPVVKQIGFDEIQKRYKAVDDLLDLTYEVKYTPATLNKSGEHLSKLFKLTEAEYNRYFSKARMGYEDYKQLIKRLNYAFNNVESMNNLRANLKALFENISIIASDTNVAANAQATSTMFLNNLLSNLQHLYKVDVSTILGCETVADLEQATKLFSNINAGLYSGQLAQRYTQADVAKLLNIDNISQETLHNAKDDVLLTEMIYNKLVQLHPEITLEQGLTRAQRPKLFYDTETVGLRNNTEFRELYIKIEGDDKGCHLYFDVDEATFNTFTRQYKVDLLHIPESKVDTMTYAEWHTEYLDTITKNTKDSFKPTTQPLSDLENLRVLYNYLNDKSPALNTGELAFSLVGYNSSNFDNARVYQLIQRTLSSDTLTDSDKNMLFSLLKTFSPKQRNMTSAIDVYTLFLQYELKVLQLNSNMKNEIFLALKNYATAQKNAHSKLFSLDVVSMQKDLLELKKLTDYNGIVFGSDKLNRTIEKLDYDIKDLYSFAYLQLPRKYSVEVPYTIVDATGNTQTIMRKFATVESAFTASNNLAETLGATRTTKNVVNDNVYRFFEDSPEFRMQLLSRSRRGPVKANRLANAVIDISNKYKYIACLKNRKTIQQLSMLFKYLQETKDKFGLPVGRTISLIEFLKQPDDPVELMALVQYMLPTAPRRMDYDAFLEYRVKTIQDISEQITGNEHSLDNVVEIFRDNKLYTKPEITQELSDIETEIANSAQTFEQLTEGIDTLSNRRYKVLSSELSAMNSGVYETRQLLKDLSNQDTQVYYDYRNLYQKTVYDNTVNSIAALSDEDLFTFYLQQGRIIVFEKDESNETLTKLLKRLQDNSKYTVFEETTKDSDTIVWTCLNKDVKSFYSINKDKYRLTKYGKDLKPVNIKIGDIELCTAKEEAISALVKAQRRDIDYFKNFIDKNNINGYEFDPRGVPSTEARFSSIYDRAPDEIKEALPAKEILLSPKNTNWYNPFNASYNLIGSNAFKRSVFLIQDPTDYYSSYYQYVRTVIQKQTTKQQVGALFESALDGTAYNKFTDKKEEALNLLKAKEIANYISEHPEYKIVSRITYTNKSGKVVDKIITVPNNEYTLMKLYKKGFTVMVDTTQNCSTMMDVFNYKIDNVLFNSINLILRLFKVATLTSVGVITRNSVDSYLKNAEEMGIAETTKYVYKAMRLKHVWHKCYREIIENAQFEINFVNPKWWDNAVHLYFNGGTRNNLDELTFLSLYEFFNEGPSSAILQDLDIVKNYRTAYTFGNGKATASITELTKWYKVNQKNINPKTVQEQMNNGLNKMFNLLLGPNVYVEKVNRLAMFLKYSDDGYLNTTQIYKRIADTHFDFSYKNNFHKTMELLIPFYSFTKDNILFWMRVADNNPVFYKRILDVMTPIMNIDDYTVEELERNKSLVNQLRTGQIVISPNADLTLKLNPSFLDVLNIFTNPVEALEQRLVSPAGLALRHAEEFIVQNQYDGYTIDNKDLLNMLPVVGTVSTRISAIQRNLERISKKPKLTDTQKLAAKPFAAVSSTFGVTQRYNIYKYTTDRYYTTRSSEYYKNSTAPLRSSTIKRPKKIYYPMDKPSAYSSSYYKFLYIKSLQRYFNN